MIKKIYILIFVSILGNSVFGQFIGRDNLSISSFYMMKQELDSARKYIDLAIKDDVLKNSAKTWFYRGNVYKEIYKNKEKEDKLSKARLASIESLQKMFTLSGKEEFEVNAIVMLKYLAAGLNNDALSFIHLNEFDLAESNFDSFKDAMLLIGTNFNVKEKEIVFKLSVASKIEGNGKLAEGLDTTQFNRLKGLYLEVLSIDPNHPKANYNLAILYYNAGVNIIHGTNYDIDLNEVYRLQDKTVDFFLKGLPYMKKAYDVNYKKEVTLDGLAGIYLALNDFEKYETFRKELEELRTE